MKDIIENRIKNLKETKKVFEDLTDQNSFNIEAAKETAKIFESKITLLQSILDEYKEQQTVNEPVTYKIGQRFNYKNSGDYIVAQTGCYEINLISLKGGNRYGTTTKVKDIYKITEQELGKVLEEDRSYFELLKK